MTTVMKLTFLVTGTEFILQSVERSAIFREQLLTFVSMSQHRLKIDNCWFPPASDTPWRHSRKVSQNDDEFWNLLFGVNRFDKTGQLNRTTYQLKDQSEYILFHSSTKVSKITCPSFYSDSWTRELFQKSKINFYTIFVLCLYDRY